MVLASADISPRLERKADARSVFLTLFLLTILMPFAFTLAGLRLSPNRVYLLLAIVPCVIAVVQGRITLIDALLMLHGLWIVLALLVMHGPARLPFAGITAVELVGGYFVGRALVRSEQDYRRVLRFILISLIVLLPFVVVETLSGRQLILEAGRLFSDTPVRGHSAYGRIGLERAYGVFHHPILYGLYCATLLANAVYLMRSRITLTWMTMALALGMTFMSLSSAPLLACGMQIGLLLWWWLMRGRWVLLIILSVLAYVALDLASNRTPITIMIDTVTFNSGTGWVRIAIFKYGWAAALDNPIFGIGFNDWPKPSWLTHSVDNFWLLTAMRYGMPGAGLLIAAFLFHLLLMGRAKLSGAVDWARITYVITLISIGFTLITVHIWETLAVFVMFYIGAGAWMYQQPPQNPDVQAHPERPMRAPVRYTRFAPE